MIGGLQKSAALPVAAGAAAAARMAAPHVAKMVAKKVVTDKVVKPAVASGVSVVKNKLGGKNQPETPEKAIGLPESPKPVSLNKSAQLRMHDTYVHMREMEKQANPFLASLALASIPVAIGSAGLVAASGATALGSLGVAGAMAAGGAAKTVGVFGARKMYQNHATETIWDRLTQRRPEWKNNPKAREHFEVIQQFSPDVASNITTAESYIDRSLRTSMVPHEFVKDLTGIQKTRAEGSLSKEFLSQRADIGAASAFANNVTRAGLSGYSAGHGLGTQGVGAYRGYQQSKMMSAYDPARQTSGTVGQSFADSSFGKAPQPDDPQPPQYSSYRAPRGSSVSKIRQAFGKSPWGKQPSTPQSGSAPIPQGPPVPQSPGTQFGSGQTMMGPTPKMPQPSTHTFSSGKQSVNKPSRRGGQTRKDRQKKKKERSSRRKGGHNKTSSLMDKLAGLDPR